VRSINYKLLISLLLVSPMFLASCGKEKTRIPIPDETKVWDKQLHDKYVYLLIRNLEGFADVMEGVRLYRYPQSLDETTDEKYSKKYLVFDEEVQDIDPDELDRQKAPRAVMSARLDLNRKKVFVQFNHGKSQTLDVSRYAL